MLIQMNIRCYIQVFKDNWRVSPPVGDAGIQTFRVLPVGPFHREPPGGSSHLIAHCWSKLSKITKMIIRQCYLKNVLILSNLLQVQSEHSTYKLDFIYGILQ